jgi:hypothetical protein
MPSDFGERGSDTSLSFDESTEDASRHQSQPATDDDPIRLRPISRRNAYSISLQSKETSALPVSHQPSFQTVIAATRDDASVADPQVASALAGKTTSIRSPSSDAEVAEDFLLGVINQEGESLSQEQRLENAQSLYNNSAGLYPRQRNYPTLEAMQRLNKIFGYAAIAIVFPYLLGRLIYLIYKTETGLMLELGRFSEFAIPVLFATVGLVGFLFAACEGIQLLIDVQDNLLRIANRSGRRKE